MPPPRIPLGEPVSPPDAIGFSSVAAADVAALVAAAAAPARPLNGHARAAARSGERRWRDMQWVDFTTADDVDEPDAPIAVAALPAPLVAVRDATPLGGMAPATPPIRFRPGRTMPLRRAPEIVPGLVARFTRLPAVRPELAASSRLVIAAPTDLVIRPRDRMLAVAESIPVPVVSPAPPPDPASSSRAGPAWLVAPPARRRRRVSAMGHAIAFAARARVRRALARVTDVGAVLRYEHTLAVEALATIRVAAPAVHLHPAALLRALSQIGSAIGAGLADAMRRAQLPIAAIARGRRRLVVAAASIGAALAVGLLVYKTGGMIAGLNPAPSAVPVAAAAPAPPLMPSTDPVARAAYYLARAKSGDPAAQYDVAVLYARGAGLVQDFASAAAWFHAAAVQGNTAAQYDLGVIYERGLGVSPNPAEALDWYRTAAEHDHPAAAYNLALALAEGRGAEADVAGAAHWYQRAAVRGVIPAMINLAILYEQGRGVERSLADAYAWYSAAGGRGDAEAQRRAALLARQFAGSDRHRAEMLAAMIAGSIRPMVAPPAS